MATSISTILDWFRTGKKPTQSQFWDTWKSFWHKEEVIPQTSIENLIESLNSKVNDTVTLTIKNEIPDSANLNDYTTGLYIQPLNAWAASGLNYPIPISGKLEVVGEGDRIYQEYHSYGTSNCIYYRTFFVHDGWSPWKKISDANDLTIMMKRGAVINQNANTDFEQATGYWNFEGENGNPLNFHNNATYGNFMVIGDGTFNTQMQFVNGGELALRTKYYLSNWEHYPWRIVWDNHNLTAATQLDTAELLHINGNESKEGNLSIGGTTYNLNDYRTLSIGGNAINETGLLKFRSVYNSGNGAELFQDIQGNVALNKDDHFRYITFLSNGNTVIGSNDDTGDKLQISGSAYFKENIKVGTETDNNTGSMLQINGRASGEPAIHPNEFVTKSQIDSFPYIISTDVELTMPSIAESSYHEESLYFEGAYVGAFVEMVIPQTFNIPFLDIKCLCIDQNKIMVRFTTISQNYIQGNTGTFKFRIIK